MRSLWYDIGRRSMMHRYNCKQTIAPEKYATLAKYCSMVGSSTCSGGIGYYRFAPQYSPRSLLLLLLQPRERTLHPHSLHRPRVGHRRAVRCTVPWNLDPPSLSREGTV